MKTARRKQEGDEHNKLRNSKNIWKLRYECMDNAVNLVTEAEILFKNKCYPRAFLLAYTVF
jgi:AbiV